MPDTRSDSNLGQLLLRAFRWFDEGLVARLHAAGWPELTRAHSLLFAVTDQHGTRISELARRAGVTRQSAHQLVTELVRLGLMELRADPANKSAKLAVPTVEGRRSVQAALRAIAELERELSVRIGPDQVIRLRDALDRDWGSPLPPGQHS